MSRSRKYFIAKCCFGMMMGSANVFATNGLYLEGYGPIAASLGGSGIAFYHGTGGVMHNPATLALRQDGYQLDIGMVFIAANINAELEAADLDSSTHNRVFLPTLGILGKQGRWGFGFMVYPQGGLGTAYSEDRFLSAGTHEEPFSEFGSVKVSLPVTFDVTDQLHLGASVSVLRGMIDLEMPLTGAQFADFVKEFGGTQTFGTASGSFVDATGQAIAAGVFNPNMPLNHARLKFVDQSPLNGEANGYGFGGHIGLVYEITDQFSVGLTYQTKLRFEDLDADSAKLVLNANVDDNILNGTYVPGEKGAPAGTYTTQTLTVRGDVAVKDLALPAYYGIGFSYKVNDQLMLVADIKRLNWRSVLKSLKLTFDIDGEQGDPLAAGVAGTSVDLELFQDWRNQTIYTFGAQYKISDALSVRAGASFAKSPIPSDLLNPLFPAIVKNHFTAGMSYQLNPAQGLHAALIYAPEAHSTNDVSGIEVSHRQVNVQLMFTQTF